MKDKKPVIFFLINRDFREEELKFWPESLTLESFLGYNKNNDFDN